MNYKNGDEYNGNQIDDKRNGEGSIIYKNGINILEIGLMILEKVEEN